MTHYKDSLNSVIQRRKHIPATGDDIFSIHQRDKQKTLWYSSNWESMDSVSVPTNKGRVIYKSKIYPYHSLHRGVLTSLLPSVRVKEGEDIKLRWCDDVFISMIESFKVLFNDTELQYGNDKLLFVDKEKYEMSGASSTWKTDIAEQPISIEPPFFYTRLHSRQGGEVDAFPLHLCGQNDRLHHVFEFNLDIPNLLLMLDSENNVVPVDMSKVIVSDNRETVPVPDLEGLYTTHVGENRDFINEKENSIFPQTINYIEDDNEVDLGRKINLKIDSRNNYPIEEIAWGALNSSETRKTNAIQVLKGGHSPVKSSKLVNKNTTIIDNKESFKTEYIYNTTNYVKGVSRWRNSICDTDPKKFSPGMFFNGGSLTINTINSDSCDRFVAFMVLKYTRQFNFTSFPKTQQERLTKGATIELVNE